MITEKIRTEIRSSIRKRKPIDFYGLYEETFQHLTGVFWYIDRNLLRQILVSEIFETCPKKISEKDKARLTAIWRDADKAREKAKFETINI